MRNSAVGAPETMPFTTESLYFEFIPIEKMNDSSLVQFCIVVILNVLFVLNFCFVRVVERKAIELVAAENDTDIPNVPTNSTDPSALTSEPKDEPTEESTTAPDDRWSVFLKRLHLVLYGFTLDSVYRQHNDIHEFPGWNRKWVATASTAFLVIGSSFVMSPQFAMTGAMSVFSASPDFCSTDVRNDKLEVFRASVHNATKLDMAHMQVDRMLTLFDSLQSDITLYGEPGYTCEDIGDIPGTKAKYKQRKLDAINGPFFPGYCKAALKKSIELAKAQQCERRVCAKVRKLGITWAKKCVMVAEPCPAPSGDTEKALADYESTQADMIRQKALNQTAVEFGDEFAEGTEETYDRASRLVSKLLRQVNVAGTIYTVYACIGLLLPAPIVMFRSPLRVHVSRFLFGVNRYQFVVLVIALWWAVEYSTLAWQSPKLRLFALNMFQDPCFVDSDFVTARQNVLEDTCDEMLTLVNNFTTYDPAIDHTTTQLETFIATCSDRCGFPNVKMSEIQAVTTAEDVDSFRKLGFDRRPGALEDLLGSSVLLPNEDAFEFAGNFTLCVDPVEAQRFILSTRQDDPNINYWELWISSGLVARILIKFVVANLALSLYYVADPLARCGGRFEYPPGRHHIAPSEFQSLREQAWTSLWATSIKWCLLWFFLSVSCIVSLFSASDAQTMTMETLSSSSVNVLASGVAICVVYVGMIVMVWNGRGRSLYWCLTCRRQQQKSDAADLPKFPKTP